MKDSDLKILKIIIEAVSEPSLMFYPKQGDIGDKIWKKIYPDWENPDAKRLLFKNLDDKEFSIIEFKRIATFKEENQKYSPKDIPTSNFLEILEAYKDA